MSGFAGFLKQSTSKIVAVGPFLNFSDGALKTSVALGASEAFLIKDAGTATDVHTNTFSAHLGGGMYNFTLAAGDTDTLGMLTLLFTDSASVTFSISFMVVPANIYDSLIGGTDALQVDAIQINGNVTSAMLSGTTSLNADIVKINTNAASSFLSGTDALNADATKISGSSTAADMLELLAKGGVSGVVQSGSSTSVLTTNLTQTNNDHFNGRSVVFITGTNQYVAAEITDYSGSSKELTISAVPVAPSAGDVFVIV